MERLETAARPVLEPMLLGAPPGTLRVLDPDQQAILATWAVKISLLLTLSQFRGQDYGWTPVSTLQWLYKHHDSRMPPPGSRVWMGGFNTSDVPARVQAGCLYDVSGKPAAQCVTFSVGCVLFQVFTTGQEDANLSPVCSSCHTRPARLCEICGQLRPLARRSRGRAAAAMTLLYGAPLTRVLALRTTGLWAIGDVTGISLFTHVAMYQGRVVAGNILGRDRTASYHGIPRVIFADPEIAATGYTTAQAREAGIDVAATEISLADSIDRPWTYERDPRGALGLIADRRRRVLAGAWAVAPLASEWIHQAALAIRAQIPIDTLLDQVAQYPTYSEAYLAALEQLAL
jgi:Pyridine nucleotide-disulphide oxidoreductase, dimerisation domain